jgi:hypothetical protein
MAEIPRFKARGGSFVYYPIEWLLAGLGRALRS